MNKKKILILLILFIAIVGFTLAPTVSAKTYTTKSIKFKDNMHFPVKKYLGKHESLSVYYNSKYSPQHDSKNFFTIHIYSSIYGPDPEFYKVTKAKVKFTKKVNGKTKTYTNTYYADKKWGVINKHPPKGWKPYSAVVTYKDI